MKIQKQNLPGMALVALLFSSNLLADDQLENTSTKQAVEITEWTVPWNKTRPRDPDVAADGSIWFVGQAAIM